MLSRPYSYVLDQGSKSCTTITCTRVTGANSQRPRMCDSNPQTTHQSRYIGGVCGDSGEDHGLSMGVGWAGKWEGGRSQHFHAKILFPFPCPKTPPRAPCITGGIDPRRSISNKAAWREASKNKLYLLFLGHLAAILIACSPCSSSGAACCGLAGTSFKGLVIDTFNNHQWDLFPTQQVWHQAVRTWAASWLLLVHLHYIAHCACSCIIIITR